MVRRGGRKVGVKSERRDTKKGKEEKKENQKER